MICVGCTKEIIGCQHESCIFGTDWKHSICTSCADIEENCIANKGTNNIPNLQAQYAANAQEFGL